ncbi:resistin isoform X1 [Antechinus flavipes]|uniref:resistin isoform X1 n=1 Tax=Antechinus flavipes TaxID=38775 RepID=UPI0022359443|nr:resistin isoform X1 [Antechinus flavipes]
MASLGASGMMTASFCLFLIFLILPGQLVLGCPLDDLLNKKIEEQASSYVLATLQKLQLICSSVTSRGALATCPSDSIVTGCSCGSACGSWDVRGTTTCHCQCAGMDWTSARCCRLGN